MLIGINSYRRSNGHVYVVRSRLPIQFRHPRGVHYPDRGRRSRKEICFIILATILIFFVEIAARTWDNARCPLFSTADKKSEHVEAKLEERARERQTGLNRYHLYG